MALIQKFFPLNTKTEQKQFLTLAPLFCLEALSLVSFSTLSCPLHNSVEAVADGGLAFPEVNLTFFPSSVHPLLLRPSLNSLRMCS